MGLAYPALSQAYSSSLQFTLTNEGQGNVPYFGLRLSNTAGQSAVGFFRDGLRANVADLESLHFDSSHSLVTLATKLVAAFVGSTLEKTRLPPRSTRTGKSADVSLPPSTFIVNKVRRIDRNFRLFCSQLLRSSMVPRRSASVSTTSWIRERLSSSYAPCSRTVRAEPKFVRSLTESSILRIYPLGSQLCCSRILCQSSWISSLRRRCLVFRESNDLRDLLLSRLGVKC